MSATRSGIATGTISVAGFVLTPASVNTEMFCDGLGQLVLEN